jgi:hypothetical protein
MAGCGYTPAEIDAMSLDDVRGLFAYWGEHPPTHEILQAVYQVERKPKPAEVVPADSNDPSGLGSLIARFPNGFVKVE